MAKCAHCDAELPAGATACPACNTPVAPAQPLGGPIPLAGERTPQAPSQPLGGPTPLAGQNTPQPLGGPIPLAGPPSAQRPTAPGEPLAPPPSPGRRVTLTGEVIEEGMATQMPGGDPRALGVPNLQPGAPRPSAPNPYAQPRQGGYSMPARRETAPARTGGGAGIVVAVLVVVLLAAGGVFGWMYWQKRQPAIAAEKALTAVKAKDWKTFYGLLDIPEAQKAQLTEQRFVQVMGIVGGIFQVSDFTIGEVTLDGETATVKASVTVSAGGRTQTQSTDIKMRNVGGQWKLVLGGGGMMPSLPSGGLRGMPGGMPNLR